ncbi:MAG: c-type cytochrome [Gaiellales bacterium]
MIKVLAAGLIGTIGGVVAMIIVIVLAGTTTSGASSVGLGTLPLSTASLSSGPASTPTSTPPPDTGGGSTGGSTSGAAGNADNGKVLFTGSAGCGSCHTLAAAGTTGTVGPDLDSLAADAQKAGEPLDAFIKSSIVDPGAYVPSGYTDGVMPTTFGTSLSASDIDDLVAFISASQK